MVTVGGHYVWQAEHAESVMQDRKNWLFSGAFSSGASLAWLSRVVRNI